MDQRAPKQIASVFFVGFRTADGTKGEGYVVGRDYTEAMMQVLQQVPHACPVLVRVK